MSNSAPMRVSFVADGGDLASLGRDAAARRLCGRPRGQPSGPSRMARNSVHSPTALIGGCTNQLISGEGREMQSNRPMAYAGCGVQLGGREKPPRDRTRNGRSLKGNRATRKQKSSRFSFRHTAMSPSDWPIRSTLIRSVENSGHNRNRSGRRRLRSRPSILFTVSAEKKNEK